MRWHSLAAALFWGQRPLADIAEQLGVCEGTVRQWVSGEFSPTLERFRLIISVLSETADTGSERYKRMARELFADAPVTRRTERKKRVISGTGFPRSGTGFPTVSTDEEL